MPYYVGVTKEGCVSDVTQPDGDKYCYVYAPMAAYALRNVGLNQALVLHTVGAGMGGSSDRAFRAMGLHAFNKADNSYWRDLITQVVDRGDCFACLGINWTATRPGASDRAGNHVVYVIGYEGDIVYARDQQLGHVLIEVRMVAPWTSAAYVVGGRTFTCTVSWAGIGTPSRATSQELLG